MELTPCGVYLRGMCCGINALCCVLAGTFHPEPLPSAGVISIMQAFCDGGVEDDDGFMSYPHAE